MRYVDNKIEDLNIAYIGGGSRSWAWILMNDLALEGQLSGTVKLYDIDHEAACCNEKIGNRLTSRDDVVGKWVYKVVDSLEEALRGADFVVISILPGTFNEMASDIKLPEKYGIYQSVGDTVGPGGLIRALRTIPIYAEFAESIKFYAPDAWVINYTNPMTVCTCTLYKVFPDIKAFGCCHGVFETQQLLAVMLDDMLGIKGVNRSEIKTNVLGINHFTWIDEASYKGIDLVGIYKEFVDKYFEDGFVMENNDDQEFDEVHNLSFFTSLNRVQFDLFKRYGLIVASGDRHAAEFMPPWYLKNPETVEKWGFGLTPIEWRMSDQEERIQKSLRLASGEEEIQLKASGEEGVAQIKALLGLGDLITNVNLPNLGQMKGLPSQAVVETNALFSRNSIRPLIAGELPHNVNSLVLKHVENQELVVQAALTQNRELALNAFVNDPLVNIDINDSEELFNQMIEKTKEYLPEWE